MRMLIIGSGKTGSFLAENLWQKHELVVIDIRGDRASRIETEIPDLKVIIGDACDPNVLDAAEVAKTEVVAAVTGDDEDNLVAAWLVKRMGARTVLARVNHPNNEWLFDRSWGVDIPFSVSQLALRLVQSETETNLMGTLMHLQAEGATVEQVTLPSGCGVVGKRLRDIELPQCAQVLSAVTPEGEMETASPDLELRAGDSLILFYRCNERREVLGALGLEAPYCDLPSSEGPEGSSPPAEG